MSDHKLLLLRIAKIIWIHLILLLLLLLLLFVCFSESPNSVYSDDQKKRKFFKDSEKIPLGDNDELAMV